ncbi:hypothetical protein EQG63_10225 [Flavobacterium amnicola]|uniref:Uncharacterized protein n=1 Tax=Flavobacterium amnicola TaxID=2506422 RepID=A0A4Q1K0W2_9FLAO|nr:hypothetical protein [Flavobacterium amnicola]RXR17850.1 hypothetical protein EQG63_10225 [Flavobacterium amnicola]
MSSFFRPLFVFFSTVLIGITSYVSICAGGDWDWFESNSSFAPEAYVQDKSYEQLFYSINMFYGEDWYDNAHSNRFKESIIADWKKYLGKKLSEEQLNYYVLSDSSNVELSKISKAILKKENNKLAQKFDLKDAKLKQFFAFMNLAKSLETYSNNVASWNYNTDSLDPMQYMSVGQAKKVEDIYNLSNDPFLKNRYWFLTMKSYFYSQNRNEAITFFNKTQAKVERNELYYRGLSYIAGVLYKNKEYARSNFMYSVVFDNCPKLRTVATYSFHPQENKDFQQALAIANTNSQKAALWALYGYYGDEVEAIQQVYTLDPKNKHLDYLLTRALNIAENKMNTTEWKYAEYGSKAKIANDSLHSKLYQVVTKIANEKKSNSPHIWNIAAGYFEIIKANNAKATHYFSEAKKTIPNTKLAQEQLKLFEIFNTIASVKKIDQAAEIQLLPNLKWLFVFEKENSSDKLRTQFLINWSRNYVSSLYKKQGNEVMAELFLRDADYYLNPVRTEKMITHLNTNKYSDWHTFANSLYNIRIDDIYEFKAIKYAYNNQISQAIAEIQKSSFANVELLGNPFNGNIKDCNDCDHVAFQKTKYTKLSFLQKVKELQEITAKNGDTYIENILLGNAFYNLSYYGNARLFYDNNIINQYNTNYLNDTYKNVLMSNAETEKYYSKALLLAKNDEQKAKAIYLLTKIERNTFYLTPVYIPWEVDYVVFDGFKKLKQYSKTKYYQEVINECGYFRNIVQK